MEVNSINPVRTKFERPEPLQPVAGDKKAQVEKQETISAPEKPAPVSKTELDKAVERANDIGQLLKRKLNFSIDEATERVVVKVIDEETGEVVRQVPPSEMLRISAHLKQLQEMNDKVMSAVKSVILDIRY